MSTSSKDAAARFASDTANHAMTVLHDDGLYRHLRFQQPERSGYWFDIVTWPGSLAVRGDIGGGYVFSRLTDMFEFFRRNNTDAGINPDYWSEKLPAGRRTVQEYSEETFAELIAEHLNDYDKTYPKLVAAYAHTKTEYEASPAWKRAGMPVPKVPVPPDEAHKMLSEATNDGETSHEAGARALLAEMERVGVVSETWEWNLTGWTWPFLWLCHAIVWGISQYDTAQTHAPVAA